MKKLELFMVLLLLLAACQKEDSLKSEIELDNLFEITDDPSDSVKHYIYQIYSKYGVPIYFNDTIAKYKNGVDSKGDETYRYETIDLAWNYTSIENMTYIFEYMTDPDEQMEALGLIEEYLESAFNALHPFSFFVVKSGSKENSSTKEIHDNGYFEPSFRTLYMTGGWSDGVKQSFVSDVMREMVLKKIVNYAEQITEFKSVTDPIYYGIKGWRALNPDLPSDFGIECLDPESWKWAYLYTEEEILARQIFTREEIGKFGFVNSGKNFPRLTVENADDDLIYYVEEMLKYTKEEFTALWNHSTLVMKKYQILYDVIANEMGLIL